MKRRRFIANCCGQLVGVSTGAILISSCSSMYFASFSIAAKKVKIPKSEFLLVRNNREIVRKFVILDIENIDFPICLYKVTETNFIASLLKCTHKECELVVGGGIYTCPCHGSEFSITGDVLSGPAENELATFKIESDNENIYILLP